MFCPNCGTQNPETAATCSKCNFNLKGAAAPKFKGTMLMMNNAAGVPRPPTPGIGMPPPGAPAAGAASTAGAPAPAPAGGGMPSKLKGTMVGFAPPMPPIAPTAPRPPSVPPQAEIPAPPAFGAPPGGQAFGTPPPQPSPFGQPPGPQPGHGGPVNPLGGTMAADGVNFPFAQGAPQPRPGSGGFGAPHDGFGAPPPQQGGGFGAPPPQQAYGQDAGYGQNPQYAPPTTPDMQQGAMGGAPQGYGSQGTPGQGFPPPQQDWNQQQMAPQHQMQPQTPGGQMMAGYGQPQQQAYGQPPAQQGYGQPQQQPGGYYGQPNQSGGAYGAMQPGAFTGQPGAGTRPTVRNAFVIGIAPLIAVFVVQFLFGTIAAILGMGFIGSIGSLLALAINVWMILNWIKMIAEVRVAGGNPSLAWWPILIPGYNIYYLLMMLPPEVARAKQMTGARNPARHMVLYLFLPLFALASDLNEMTGQQ